MILILFVQHKLTNASIRALASSRLLRGVMQIRMKTIEKSVPVDIDYFCSNDLGSLEYK